MLFLELQRFFERVGVRFVDLEAQIVFVDPAPSGIDAQRRIADRNLLDRDQDLHAPDHVSNFLKIRHPLGPPNPNEFVSA